MDIEKYKLTPGEIVKAREYTGYKPSYPLPMEHEINIANEATAKVLHLQAEQTPEQLREAVARKIWYFRTGAVMSSDDHPPKDMLLQADQILALFAGQIEQARKEERERIKKLMESEALVGEFGLCLNMEKWDKFLKDLQGQDKEGGSKK